MKGTPTPIKMTASKYMHLMSLLPNPTAYVLDNKTMPGNIKLHYINSQWDTPFDIHIGGPINAPSLHKSNLMETHEIEFEVCFNGNICYWQPVIPILITPDPKRDEVMKAFHDYRQS